MLILKVLRKNCLKYQKDEFDGVVPTQHQNGNVEVPPLPLHNEEMDYIIDTDPANIMYSPRLPIQWACSSDQRQHYLSADKPVSSARVDSEYEENIHRRVKSRLEAMRKTHIAELRYSPDNTDFDFGFL